jgi:hypothetical protein
MLRWTRRSCSYSGFTAVSPAACAAMRVVPMPNAMPLSFVWS